MRMTPRYSGLSEKSQNDMNTYPEREMIENEYPDRR